VEDSGLAGTVRTDDRGNLAAISGKGQIVDGDQPAKTHRQTFDRKQRHPRLDNLGHRVDAGCGPRRTVGSRCEIKPCGRHTMTPIIAAPKISIRNSAKARPNSGKVTSRIAASTTPIWLPMPPSTTIARIVADSMKVKLSGLMKPCRVAKK